MSGFYEIIPKELISIVSPPYKFFAPVSLKCIQFNEQELELIISGTPDIDVDEWKAATEYNGYASSDPVIVWWWRALKSFNREERAKVLSFATGTSRVPLGGFVDLQGVEGVQRFSIHRAYGDPSRLPQAHIGVYKPRLGLPSLQPGPPAKLPVHVQALTKSTYRSTHRMRNCVRNFYSQSTKEKNHWAWRRTATQHPPGRARGLRETRRFCVLLFLSIPRCDAIFDCFLPLHPRIFSCSVLFLKWFCHILTQNVYKAFVCIHILWDCSSHSHCFMYFPFLYTVLRLRR